ncbi:MAG: hypothetical protein OXC41_01660 [Gammaproteobacteria bacterium]|nr:hypothetical protein [Gammaproteobacteria bacterium]
MALVEQCRNPGSPGKRQESGPERQPGRHGILAYYQVQAYKDSRKPH